MAKIIIKQNLGFPKIRKCLPHTSKGRRGQDPSSKHSNSKISSSQASRSKDVALKGKRGKEKREKK